MPLTQARIEAGQAPVLLDKQGRPWCGARSGTTERVAYDAVRGLAWESIDEPDRHADGGCVRHAALDGAAAEKVRRQLHVAGKAEGSTR